MRSPRTRVGTAGLDPPGSESVVVGTSEGRVPPGRAIERPAGGLQVLLPRRYAWQLSDTISISVTWK